MLQIVQTKQYKSDLKKVARSGRYHLEDLLAVIAMLAREEELPPKHRDHPLSGDWCRHRECHICPDWLLIYKVTSTQLTLVRTGSHSELFG